VAGRLPPRIIKQADGICIVRLSATLLVNPSMSPDINRARIEPPGARS
jgi:hypothetical protein